GTSSRDNASGPGVRPDRRAHDQCAFLQSPFLAIASSLHLPACARKCSRELAQVRNTASTSNVPQTSAPYPRPKVNPAGPMSESRDSWPILTTPDARSYAHQSPTPAPRKEIDHEYRTESRSHYRRVGRHRLGAREGLSR